MSGELRRRYRSWCDLVSAEARRECGEALIGAVVFGSVGRDTPHPGSDIDMLLVIRALPAGRAARRLLAARVEDRARIPAPDLPELCLVVRTPEEVRAGFPLLLDITQDGRVLVDSAGCVQALLSEWRNRLAAHGARRISSGAAWHWDLGGHAAPGEWRL